MKWSDFRHEVDQQLAAMGMPKDLEIKEITLRHDIRETPIRVVVNVNREISIFRER